MRVCRRTSPYGDFMPSLTDKSNISMFSQDWPEKKPSPSECSSSPSLEVSTSPPSGEREHETSLLQVLVAPLLGCFFWLMPTSISP